MSLSMRHRRREWRLVALPDSQEQATARCASPVRGAFACESCAGVRGGRTQGLHVVFAREVRGERWRVQPLRRVARCAGFARRRARLMRPVTGASVEAWRRSKLQLRDTRTYNRE
ncbi:hypothetical protein [uncultured Aquimonas sp.]|uniref:hypothetical protein n=1 Tax=uncultured Aquimonas sp. TaxID=385483 RepID=UPI00261CC827|nr:hypothetical protein [uncultured Aquimonas sp.]